MFWKKKAEPRPFGVPLDDLLIALAATTLKAKREENSLIVQHEKFVTRVDVVQPEHRDSANGTIKAVIQIRTELPAALSVFLDKPGLATTMNAMATLGSIGVDNGKSFIGSRLTMYDEEDAWKIQFPLVLFSIIGAAESILGALRRMMNNGESKHGASDWNQYDLQQAEKMLSNICACTTGGLGLTAEFGLREGAVSAITGDHHTALWQLRADQPHPEMGGGLFCLLQMPHQLSTEDRLDRILENLNKMEMQPHDLPPHFGAWCRGRSDNNPAYASFLPNALHSLPGIAVNMSVWGLARAQWANAMLASMGVRA